VPAMVCISVITRAELLYGLKRLPPEHRLHLAVQQFFKIVRVPLMATSNSPTCGQSNSPRQDG